MSKGSMNRERTVWRRSLASDQRWLDEYAGDFLITKNPAGRLISNISKTLPCTAHPCGFCLTFNNHERPSWWNDVFDVNLDFIHRQHLIHAYPAMRITQASLPHLIASISTLLNTKRSKYIRVGARHSHIFQTSERVAQPKLYWGVGGKTQPRGSEFNWLMRLAVATPHLHATRTSRVLVSLPLGKFLRHTSAFMPRKDWQLLLAHGRVRTKGEGHSVGSTVDPRSVLGAAVHTSD
jgi:hypothetical protein